MKVIILLGLSLVAFTGCNGVDRLLNGERKSTVEDTTPVPPDVARPEPYAVFSGYRSTGERLYIIHWTHSSLDNTGMPESEVDARGIPKYQS